jgi:uncharacterized protein YjbI with pentapeptide repeats
LVGTNLHKSELKNASLCGANLTKAILVEADISGADLTNCCVYGAAAWNMVLTDETKQNNLIITPQNEAEVTTDDIEVAQFVYLLIHNKKLRNAAMSSTQSVERGCYCSAGSPKAGSSF